MLHLRPHTSCRWPCNLRSDCSGGARISRCRIRRSLLPDDSWSTFHVNAPGSRNTHTIKKNYIYPVSYALSMSVYVHDIDARLMIKCNFTSHLFSYIGFCLLFCRTPLTQKNLEHCRRLNSTFMYKYSVFMHGKKIQ